jgi:hypothetical protein
MRKKYRMKHNRATTPNRVMIQCATVVNRDAIRRETIDGVEHIIVSSFTLPDDVVMNGGLYPAEEIAKSFQSLDRTFAPIEHPTDSQGNFISASDPTAVHNFDGGAFNTNVTQENGRVHVEKHINVQVALRTEKGKRLLDRINELETSDDPRPIHTSVGVFLFPDELDEPQTNAAGQEFTWVARDMLMDHDAILLDSVGAAQPDQGVGMAVNRDGAECKVDRFVLSANDLAERPKNDGNKHEPRDMRSNDEHGMSMSELHEAVREGLERASIAFGWIEELFSETVIFSSASFEEFFTVPFTIDETTNRVTIVGIPVPVERNVTFTPKVNSEKGDAMKDLMLKALAAAGMTVNADISDADLLAQYNELQANQSEGDGDGAGDDNAADLAGVVANALKPVTEELAGLKAQMNAQADKDKADLVAVVANSDKYPAIDEETAKLIPIDKLREMSANCGTAHGIPMTTNSGDSGESAIATEMPE